MKRRDTGIWFMSAFSALLCLTWRWNQTCHVRSVHEPTLLPCRHVSVCEALVQHGATVNAEDDDKRTPLFYAVQQVHT
jgi:hypothetical protein